MDPWGQVGERTFCRAQGGTALVDPRTQILHTSQNEFSPHPVLEMQTHLFLNTGIFSSRPFTSICFYLLKAQGSLVQEC